MDSASLVHNIALLVERDGGANPEQLRRAYASYRPSFMEIKLPFSFQGDLNTLSEQDFGVMLHEYVHYLQNLSTPWGLYSSMEEYAELVEAYRMPGGQNARGTGQWHQKSIMASEINIGVNFHFLINCIVFIKGYAT